MIKKFFFLVVVGGFLIFVVTRVTNTFDQYYHFDEELDKWVMNSNIDESKLVDQYASILNYFSVEYSNFDLLQTLGIELNTDDSYLLTSVRLVLNIGSFIAQNTLKLCKVVIFAINVFSEGVFIQPVVDVPADNPSWWEKFKRWTWNPFADNDPWVVPVP